MFGWLGKHKSALTESLLESPDNNNNEEQDEDELSVDRYGVDDDEEEEDVDNNNNSSGSILFGGLNSNTYQPVQQQQQQQQHQQQQQQSRSTYHSSLRGLYWQQLHLHKRLTNQLQLDFQRLLSDSDGNDDNSDGVAGEGSFSAALLLQQQQQQQSGWWWLLLLQRRLRLMSRVLLLLIDAPLTLLRLLTIPVVVVDDEDWNKPLVVVQCFTVPTMLLWLFGGWYVVVGGWLPLPLLLLMLMVVPAAIMAHFTHTRRAPRKNWLLLLLLMLSSLVMNVLWIYMLAGELVTVLSFFGNLNNISDNNNSNDSNNNNGSFLGLTVLAWGNSMGDFFANTALARRGNGAMALAGCYGSPIFDISIGFGVALLFSALKSTATTATAKEPLTIELDTASTVSLIVLLLVLSATIVLMLLLRLAGNQHLGVPRKWGWVLMAIYAIFLLIQVVIVLSQNAK